MMKLACADFTFPLLPHDKVLSVISMLEFPGVDIGLFEGRSHLRPSAMFTNVEKNARELAHKLRDNNLTAADIFLQTAEDFTSVAANHPEAAVREKARQMFVHTLEFASICNGRHVSSLPGVVFEEEAQDVSYGRACEELNWRCEKAKEYGLVFSVEAHVGSIVPDPVSAEKLVLDVPGLTLTLDYTHFTKQGLPDSQVEPLIKYASHFHARGASKGFLQASLKESTIDYARVVEVMKETDYKGYIGVEYIWIDWESCNKVDNLSEVIMLRDFLREQTAEA
jgi:sugar phosphate isomerase/epimerase